MTNVNQSGPVRSTGRRLWDRPHVVLLFLLPAVIMSVMFIAYPAASSAYYSLFEWQGLGGSRQFVGLDNWHRLVEDPIIWVCVWHNIVLVITAVFFQVPAAFVIAFLVARAFVIGRSGYRVAYFLPVILTVSVVGVLWTWIYHPQFGILNEALRGTGLDELALPWLGSSKTALPAVIVVMLWRFTGFYIVLFMAAIARVPEDIYDAATVDGANLWQLGARIVAPMLWQVILVAVTIAVVSSIKRFDLAYIMTAGGPVHATELLATYLFKVGILSFNMGYGSAIATFLFLLTLALVMIQFRGMGSQQISEF